MNDNIFPAMPLRAEGIQGSEPNATEISASVRKSMSGRHGRTLDSDRTLDNDHTLDSHDQDTRGPLKEIVAHQDSLYKYISWEDPAKTLGSYLGVMTILFGAHYLPLTRYALKAGAIALGVMSVTEFAARSFGPDTFTSRLRPREYKRVPESTLNATLKDIHDFVQYGVVKIQKLFWGQDLDRTFAAFVAFAGLYWLVKILNPFSLTVLGVNLVYIAPLVTSARGREIAQSAVDNAGELANTAAEKTTALAQQGKAQAADLTSKASETANKVRQHGEGLIQSGKETASDVSKEVKGTSNVSRRTEELNKGEPTGFQPSKGHDFSTRATDLSSTRPNDISSSLSKDSSSTLSKELPFTRSKVLQATSSKDLSSQPKDFSTSKPSSHGASSTDFSNRPFSSTLSRTSNKPSTSSTSTNPFSDITTDEPVHKIDNITEFSESNVNTVSQDSNASMDEYDNNDNHYVFAQGNTKFDNRGHVHLAGSEPRQANFSPGISRKEVTATATQDVKPIRFPEAIKSQSFEDST